MPQPNKKRGRRMGGKKRKLEDEADATPDFAEGSGAKRRKSAAADDQDDDHIDPGVYEWDVQDEEEEPQITANDSLANAYPPPAGTAFFGTLEEEEQEYFKRADDLLDANSFADQEERDLFLANVWKEADGKELKIAQSQSCSRLMEKLIQLSNAAQLKMLFSKFAENFIHLVSHRFSSHCCEALFLRAAPFVSEELLAGSKSAERNDTSATNPSDVSMEKLFLQTLDELEGNMGFLMTDRYASHALRSLLLVLSGEPMDTISTKHLLQSRKKETNAVQNTSAAEEGAPKQARRVPESFGLALEKVIADSVAGLDTDKLRALATHPNGNPTLQLLLQTELKHFGRQRGRDERSIIRTLLPDEPITKDSGSAKFINGLVYDPIGSHLVERIIEYAPGKMFKHLFAEFFKERLSQHARSEIAGYVVCRILERLGQDDLHIAHEELIPVVTALLQRGRTMVVRTLIERCAIRDIDTKAIAVQVNNTWSNQDGFEVEKLLKWGHGLDIDPNPTQDGTKPNNTSTAADVAPFIRSSEPIRAHYNILAQAMLLVPGSLSALVLDSLITLEPNTLIAMSQDPIVSRTLQAALTSRNASMITTRKLIQRFYGHMAEMAQDKSASHVVDCMWEGTHGLAFIRERIAEELAEEEKDLRDSTYGRAVWKNWKMDLYKRRRQDWIRQSKVKASNDGFQSFAELDAVKEGVVETSSTSTGAPVQAKKTPLELARERHSKKKSDDAKREQRGGRGRSKSASENRRPGAPTSGPATGANASATAAAPTAATASS